MLLSFFGERHPLDEVWVRVAKIRAFRLNSQPGGPAGEGKVDNALEDILNRHSADNSVPGSSDEGAHLTDLVFTEGFGVPRMDATLFGSPAT